MRLEKVAVDVTVTESNLQWSYINNGYHQTGSISSQQLLTTCVERKGDYSSLTLHYVVPVLQKKGIVVLRTNKKVFNGNEEECTKLAEDSQALLTSKESHRPKNIILFLNPYCGNKNGRSKYRKLVQPLFDLCGVHVELIVTRYRNETSEVIAKHDLNGVDIIVCMGGDGTASEVMTAMVVRAAADNQIDINNPDNPLPLPAVPFGFIPCGSTNVFALNTLGSWDDIETATLSLILGKFRQTDLLVVRDHNKLLSLAYIESQMGVYSHVMGAMEHLRYFGKYRYKLYPIVLLKKFWFRNLKLTFKLVPKQEEEFQYHASVTNSPNDKSILLDTPEPGWGTYTGPVSNLTVSSWANFKFVSYLFKKTFPAQRPRNICPGKLFLRIYKPLTAFSLLRTFKTEIYNGTYRVPPRGIEVAEITECTVEFNDNKPVSSELASADGDNFELNSTSKLHVKLWHESLKVICVDNDLINDILSV